MIANSEYLLLEGIAKLLRTHDPHTFHALAERLRNPEFARDLGTILDTIASSSKGKGKPSSTFARRPSDKQRIHETANSLGGSDSQKAALLRDVGVCLSNKRRFPNAKSIRYFASTIGRFEIVAKSPSAAIHQVLERLAPRPNAEIGEFLAAMDTIKSDRSLEGWTNVIFDKSLRGKKAE